MTSRKLDMLQSAFVIQTCAMKQNIAWLEELFMEVNPQSEKLLLQSRVDEIVKSIKYSTRMIGKMAKEIADMKAKEQATNAIRII